MLNAVLEGPILGRTRAQLAAIVTDGGANYVRARDDVAGDLGVFGVTCVAHGINLVMKDLMTLSPFENTVEDARTLARGFRRGEARIRLEKLGNLVSKLPCATRWNSQYVMMDRLLALKKAVRKLAKKSRAAREQAHRHAFLREEVENIALSRDFWTKMKTICQITELLYHHSLIAQRDSSTRPTSPTSTTRVKSRRSSETLTIRSPTPRQR